MTKFCMILSFILILAKIFGLITLSWFACLLPLIILAVVSVITIIILVVLTIVAFIIGGKGK